MAFGRGAAWRARTHPRFSVTSGNANLRPADVAAATDALSVVRSAPQSRRYRPPKPTRFTVGSVPPSGFLLGNPSSGGANGVPYLPAFWRDIGPYLPPRNAYILLHHTIYFNGHGTTQALTVLLIYLGVAAAILIVLDHLRRSEAQVPADAAEAAAMAVPIGATP
jgi:hypothetical protein